MKTAIIAGHTGLVGKQLLTLLLEDETYSKVIAVGRRELQIEHPKLQQKVVDFDNLHIDTPEINDVFCCLGTTIKAAGSKEKFRLVDFQYPVSLGTYCLKRGAASYSLVTAMGADNKSKIFYNKVKGEVEETVGNLGYAKVDIYRPSMLLGSRQESRLGETVGKNVMLVFGFLFIGPLKNYKAVESSKVARAMLHFACIASSGIKVHLSGEIQDY